MELFSFIYLLQEDLRLKFFEAIINKNISNELWNEIFQYFRDKINSIDNIEDEVKKLFNNMDEDNKKIFMEVIQKNDPELYNKISNKLFNFEDIVNIEKDLVKNVLVNYDTLDIYKAIMATSPEAKDYIFSIMSGRDFDSVKSSIGSVPISEIVELHEKIISSVNKVI